MGRPFFVLMDLRPAQPDDMAAITAIYGRSVRREIASFELTPPSVEEMETRFRSIVDGGYPYLVATIDGNVAGYCYASAYRPRPAYSMTVENTVYVDPRYWRQGIASRLLSALISQCRDREFQQMIAIAACKPEEEAQKISSVLLHTSLGFEIKGRLQHVGRKHGLWLDVILMQLSLE